MRAGIAVLMALALLISGCNSGEKENSLLIGAAASMQPALQKIKDAYEKENSDIEIIYTFAGSGTLTGQAINGADIDILIPADMDYANRLIENELVSDEDIYNLVENSLVLITSTPEVADGITFENLSETYALNWAIGDPDSVPAGKYAKELLISTGDYDSINDNLNLATDVRQVLSWVEAGEADMGIVYLTDALSSEKVSILDNADASLHSQITYPIVLIDSSDESAEFKNFLLGETAEDIFIEFGFIK